MTAFEAGQWVRVAHTPADVQRWSDTGTIVRIQDATGQADGPITWLIRFDLLHLERFVPQSDLTLLDG